MPVMQDVSGLQGGRFGSIAAYLRPCADPFGWSWRSLRRLRRQDGQSAQSGEVVGGHRLRQRLVDLLQSSHRCQCQRPLCLDTAEALLDALGQRVDGRAGCGAGGGGLGAGDRAAEQRQRGTCRQGAGQAQRGAGPPTAATHLKATTPPLADTARYDRLRGNGAAGGATDAVDTTTIEGANREV